MKNDREKVMSSGFVHLHVHSEYSLLDGACRITALTQRAKELGMKALALTDHGNLYGAIEFYTRAKELGIRPIIGYEAYLAPGGRLEKDPKSKDLLHHLTLLVKDSTGYQNLLRLATDAYIEGFYYKPRIDKELLSRYSSGLIALSGCMKSEINYLLSRDCLEEAQKVAAQYREILGQGNFFLEVQDNSIPEQKKLLEGAKKIGKNLGVPLIATNDVHYMSREDHEAHDILLCINTGKLVEEKDRLRFATNEFYFKSPREMLESFKEVPEAVENTLAVAEECRLELNFGKLHLPKFHAPDGMTNPQFLRALCEKGAGDRYGSIDDTIRRRLEHELKVIEETELVDYFLIVWDFVNFAHENKILTSGRGSGAGSLVAYVLKITSIDPLKYDLLFERFLNAERVTMPDLDVDFCAQGRDRVIDYARKKYGGDQHVAQIITFGTMKAKAVVRDVGRVMNIPLAEVDRVAKLIPSSPGITLALALEQEPELQTLYKSDQRIRRLFDISSRLEGLSRHASTHAAGVVISEEPLTNYVPLAKNGEVVTTQFDDVTLVEQIGLLKADFLGVRKFTVIDRALGLIKATTGKDIDLEKIPLDDRATFELLSRGDVKGVFQVETSRGFKELLRKLRPERFTDILPLIALYRPGPLQSGMVDSFINCRHGKEKPSYMHPSLEPLLRETYGIILYQEQVMRIANKLGGFTLNQADNLRKAMGKKKPEVMARYHNQFVQGAVKNGIPQKTAEEIFALMEHFAGYGFNKSHSAAYAVITYQTAYLKANYPTQYMTALMSCERQNTDKIVGYIEDCRRMDIEVLPPCINESEADFTMIAPGKIRFGLGAIKNVGEKTIESILEVRKTSGKFSCRHDFYKRVDSRTVNRQVIESLVKAGCFDSFAGHRREHLECLDYDLRIAEQAREQRSKRQLALGLDFKSSTTALGNNAVHELVQDLKTDLRGRRPDSCPACGEQRRDVPVWSEKEALHEEKGILGFYVSSHPLLKLKNFAGEYSTTAGLQESQEGEEVTVAVVITELKNAFTRKGDPMAYMVVEDLEGQAECLLFSKELSEYKESLKRDEVVLVRGRVIFRNGKPSIKVYSVTPLEVAAKGQKARPLVSQANLTVIHLECSSIQDPTLLRLRDILSSHPGECPVSLELAGRGEKARVRVNKRFFISFTEDFKLAVEDLLGPGRLRYLIQDSPSSPKACSERSESNGP